MMKLSAGKISIVLKMENKCDFFQPYSVL